MTLSLPALTRVMTALTEVEDPAAWVNAKIHWGGASVFLHYGPRIKVRSVRWRVRTPQEALENLIAADLWPWPPTGDDAARWVCPRCKGTGTRRTVKALHCYFCHGLTHTEIPTDLNLLVTVAARGPERLRRVAALAHATLPEEFSRPPACWLGWSRAYWKLARAEWSTRHYAKTLSAVAVDELFAEEVLLNLYPLTLAVPRLEP